MLKGSEYMVLAQDKSQSVRGTDRTRVNAERAVMGSPAKGFEEGYQHVPPVRTPCRHTRALVEETFQPKPPWGSNLKPHCTE